MYSTNPRDPQRRDDRDRDDRYAREDRFNDRDRDDRDDRDREDDRDGDFDHRGRSDRRDKWKVIKTFEEGKIIVQVGLWDLPLPQYSLRSGFVMQGRQQFNNNFGDDAAPATWISPYLVFRTDRPEWDPDLAVKHRLELDAKAFIDAERQKIWDRMRPRTDAETREQRDREFADSEAMRARAAAGLGGRQTPPEAPPVDSSAPASGGTTTSGRRKKPR